MRIEQLQYLIDLYYSKSITKTAEKFFVSRQVVSHSLREMEKELDLQLLERHNNVVDFTEVGKLAVEKGIKVIEAYSDFLTIAAKRVCPEDPIEEVLHIYAIPRMVATILPACLNQYRQLYPNVQIKVHTIQATDDIINILLQHEQNAIGLISYLDIAGMDLTEPFPLEYPTLGGGGIFVQPFLEGKFCLCMCKNSKYDQKALYTEADLESLPILSHVPTYLQLRGKTMDVKMNIVGSINDIEVMRQMIMQDLGVGLITVNEFNTLKNNRNLLLKPIHSASNTTIYYGCLFYQSECPNVIVEQFVQHILRKDNNIKRH